MLSQRVWQMTVVLLVAAAPLWCCCDVVMAEVAGLAGTNEPADRCCSSDDQERSGEPSSAPAQTPDEPDSECCNCEKEAAIWAAPGPGGAVVLPSHEVNVLATAYAGLQHVATPAVVGSSPHASTTQAGGVDSLYALRCLSTT